MRAGRIIVTIVGGLLTAIGVGTLAGGAVLVLAHATQRDATGYYQTSPERLETSTNALVARIDLGEVDAPVWADQELGTFRIQARSAEADGLFIGVAISPRERSFYIEKAKQVVERRPKVPTTPAVVRGQ